MQCSIIKYSKVKEVLDFRTDSEYWHPRLIKNSALISCDKKIGDFARLDVSNIKSSPINRDFNYLEISQISLNTCTYELVKVECGNEPDRAYYILKKSDIAVSTVRPNRNAVAFIEEDNIIGSSGLATLRVSGIEAEYLFAFCKTDYFIKCLMRANKASMYPAVSKMDILNTPIFLPSTSFRILIVRIIKDSLSYIRRSKQAYAHAQNIFLSELGLTDWQPKHQLTFIRNYSATRHAERIDAEYYQPKYDDIVKVIKAYKNGWDVLRNIVNFKDKNFKPKRRKIYEYVELANIAENGEITNYTVGMGNELPSRARRRVSNGDVIVSSIEGSLSSIAIIERLCLCSTGFHVINSKVFNSETLLVMMKSVVGQMQLEKGCSGSILIAINKEEAGKIVLPIIRNKTQLQIQREIHKVFDLRKQSKDLLELAKQGVQMAIEQGEAKAHKWIMKQMVRIEK